MPLHALRLQYIDMQVIILVDFEFKETLYPNLSLLILDATMLRRFEVHGSKMKPFRDKTR